MANTYVQNDRHICRNSIYDLQSCHIHVHKHVVLGTLSKVSDEPCVIPVSNLCSCHLPESYSYLWLTMVGPSHMSLFLLNNGRYIQHSTLSPCEYLLEFARETAYIYDILFQTNSQALSAHVRGLRQYWCIRSASAKHWENSWCAGRDPPFHHCRGFGTDGLIFFYEVSKYSVPGTLDRAICKMRYMHSNASVFIGINKMQRRILALTGHSLYANDAKIALFLSVFPENCGRLSSVHMFKKKVRRTSDGLGSWRLIWVYRVISVCVADI